MPPRTTSKTARRAKAPAGEAEIRSAVTAAAERLFRDRSPSKVTLREIAAEAGVNHSLLYRYFRSKDALLASVFYPSLKMIRERFITPPRGAAELEKAQAEYGHDHPAYARACAWMILEGADLDLLFRDPTDGDGQSASSSDSPLSDASTSSRLAVASYIAMTLGWDLYEPYLLRIAELTEIDRDELYEYVDRHARAVLAQGRTKAPAQRTKRA